jgi:hypothetical protein
MGYAAGLHKLKMNDDRMSATTSSASGMPCGSSPRSIPHLDIDPFAIEFFEDPYPTREKLREAAPVVCLSKWNVYGVARYAEVRAMLSDPVTFCSSRGVGFKRFRQGEAMAAAKPHSRGRSASAYPHPCRTQQGVVSGSHEADACLSEDDDNHHLHPCRWSPRKRRR